MYSVTCLWKSTYEILAFDTEPSTAPPLSCPSLFPDLVAKLTIYTVFSFEFFFVDKIFIASWATFQEVKVISNQVSLDARHIICKNAAAWTSLIQ